MSVMWNRTGGVACLALAVVLALMALLVLTSLGGDMDAFLYFQF